MRLRLAASPERAEGPKPFSSEWNNAPPPEIPPGWSPELPSWVPSERVLRIALVALLVIGSVLLGAGRDRRSEARLAAQTGLPTEVADANPGGQPVEFAAAAAATEPAAVPSTEVAAVLSVVPTATPVLPSPTPQPMSTFVPAPAKAATLPPPGAGGVAGEALLPHYRILTYYGHPHNDSMGVLGEFPTDELIAKMRQEAANYEAADPSRPVLIGFEVIASVAQGDPQSDGTYLLHTDLETLTEYADVAASNNMLLFLDLQIGRSTVPADMDGILSLLQRPNVHLALDPEFAIAEGETPGENIGELDAEQILYAQQTLAEMVAAQGLPPKMLIVHQFREDMITNKDQLAPVPGVQLVIDADGYGDPILKTDVYNILVRDQPVEFGGIKLFYKQDKPLMSAEEVVALDPSPDVIIYQ